jgi:hypothetical protein
MISKAKTHLFLKPGNLWIISLGVVVGLALAFILPSYMNLVIDLGHRIQQSDMRTDYTTAVAWAGVLGISILFWPVRNQDKTHLLWAWLLKCIVSLFVLLYYESFYASDSEGFYAVAKMDHHFIRQMIEGKLFSSFLQEGVFGYKLNILIWRYYQIVPDFLADSYHSLKLTFSMLGLIATYLFFRASIILTQKKNWNIFWFLFLFPSLLIWGSRVGKEPLVLLFLSFFALGMVGWHCKEKAGYIILALLGLASCVFMRPWLGTLFVPSVVIYFFRSNKGLPVKMAGLLAAVLLLFSSYDLIKYKLEVSTTQDVLRKLEFNRKNFALGGSALKQEAPKLSGISDLIIQAPPGIFTALFRPLPFDVSGPLGFLSGMEGLLLLFLSFRAIIRTQAKELGEPLVAWALVLVLSWAFIYGFVIQNFGTAVRWKTQVLPVFLGLLLYLGRSRSEDLKPNGSQALNPPTLNK